MPVPSSLALTTIQTNAQILSADHRNNYAAIQTAVNAIIGFLTGGSAGSVFRYNGTDWAPTTNILLDNTNSKITFGAGADTNVYRNGAALLQTDSQLILNNFSIGAPIKWAQAAMVQTTVGAAGGASALPATPTKYLKVQDNAGTTLVVPAYNP